MVEKVVLIGGSAGSLPALLQIVNDCPIHFKAPIV